MGGTERPGGDEPRWLSDPQMAAWLLLVRLVMQLPAALDRQLREDTEIPHAYYQVLAMLSAAPDRAIRMSELARLTATSQSRLSHAVSNLEGRGWVQRRQSTDDRRGQVAQLTDAGLGVLHSAAPGHVAEVRRLVFDHLDDDEVRRLTELLGKLVDPDRGPRPGRL